MSTDPTPDEQAIESALEHLDKEDLIGLVQRMVQQHPDLAGLIVPKQQEQLPIKKPRTPFNAEAYRLQVEKIFYTTDRNTWGSEARAAEPLLDIVDIADEYVEQRDFTDAAALYETIVRGILDNYDSFRWHADEGQLLEIAKRTFTAHFFEATIERYREIRQLAQQLARWDELRSELLAYVKQAHKTNVEIEIALDEGHVDLALELLKAGKQTKDPRNGPYGSTNFDVGIEVAKATEATYPQEAIEIYQAYVDMRIEWRDRRNYQVACRYLLSIRGLYQKMGKSNDWTAYIASLRERNAKLPALKDEMAKAKL